MQDVLLAYESNKRQVIPKYTREALERYVQHQIPPGSFLIAVLSNDLKESFRCADDVNIANIFAIVKYIYNEVPMSAWGSRENVRYWLSGGVDE